MFIFTDTGSGDVLATDVWTFKDYEDAQQSKAPRSCPGCGEPVHLSRKGTGTFFAKHFADSDCPMSSPESEEHQRVKLAIERALIAAGWDARAEWRRTDATGKLHIADVSATKGDRTVAFEVQLSPQSAVTTVKRQAERLRTDVDECWWLFGPKSWFPNMKLRQRGFPAASLDEVGDPGAWAVAAAEDGASGEWLTVATALTTDGLLSHDDVAGLPAEMNLGAGELNVVGVRTVRGSAAWVLTDERGDPERAIRDPEDLAECDRCGMREPTGSPSLLLDGWLIGTPALSVDCSERREMRLIVGAGTEHRCIPTGALAPTFEMPLPGSAELARIELACRKLGIPVDRTNLFTLVADDAVEFRLPMPKKNVSAGASRAASYLLTEPGSLEHRWALARRDQGMPSVGIDRRGIFAFGIDEPIDVRTWIGRVLAHAPNISAASTGWSAAWRAVGTDAIPDAAVHPAVAADVLGRSPFYNLASLVVQPRLLEAVCDCGQVHTFHSGTLLLNVCSFQGCGFQGSPVAVASIPDRRADLRTALLELGEIPERAGLRCDCGRTFDPYRHLNPDATPADETQRTAGTGWEVHRCVDLTGRR